MNVSIAVLQKNTPGGNTLWIKEPNSYGLKVRPSMTLREMDKDKTGTAYAVKSPIEIFINDFFDTSKALHKGKTHVYILRKDFGRMLHASEAVISIPMDMYELLLEEIQRGSRDAYVRIDEKNPALYQNSHFQLNRKTGECKELETPVRRHSLVDGPKPRASARKIDVPEESTSVSALDVVHHLGFLSCKEMYRAHTILGCLKLLATQDKSLNICSLASDEETPVCACGTQALYYGYNVMERKYSYYCGNPKCCELALGLVSIGDINVGFLTSPEKSPYEIFRNAIQGEHTGDTSEKLLDCGTEYKLYRDGHVIEFMDLILEIMPTLSFYSKTITSIFDTTPVATPQSTFNSALAKIRQLPILQKITEDRYEDEHCILECQNGKTWIIREKDENAVQEEVADTQELVALSDVELVKLINIPGQESLALQHQRILYDVVRLFAEVNGMSIPAVLGDDSVSVGMQYGYSMVNGKYLYKDVDSANNLMFARDPYTVVPTPTGYPVDVDPNEIASKMLSRLLLNIQHVDVMTENILMQVVREDGTFGYNAFVDGVVLSEAETLLHFAPTYSSLIDGVPADVTRELLLQDPLYKVHQTADWLLLTSIDGVTYTNQDIKATYDAVVHQLTFVDAKAVEEVAVTVSPVLPTVPEDTRLLSQSDFVDLVFALGFNDAQQALLFQALEYGVNASSFMKPELTVKQMEDMFTKVVLAN